MILLMLAISSQAQEIIVHDAHGHDSMSVSVQSAQHDAAEMDMHANHSAMTIKGDADSESCFCNDLCCMTTVEFGEGFTGLIAAPISNLQIAAENHYQSIALDLKLPPPTA